MGKPTCQGGDLESDKRLTRESIQRKKESAKTKRKAIIRKITTIDQTREQFPFWRLVTKEGKPRKYFIRKIETLGQGKSSFQLG